MHLLCPAPFRIGKDELQLRRHVLSANFQAQPSASNRKAINPPHYRTHKGEDQNPLQRTSRTSSRNHWWARWSLTTAPTPDSFWRRRQEFSPMSYRLQASRNSRPLCECSTWSKGSANHTRPAHRITCPTRCTFIAQCMHTEPSS